MSKRSLGFLAGTLIALCVNWGCASSNAPGGSNNNTNGAGIGPEGGTITSTDGRITLSIPPGALNSKQTISIESSSDVIPGGLGTAYTFKPDGLTFAKNAALTLHYSDSDVAGTSPYLLSFAFKDANGDWNGLTTIHVDTLAHTITGNIPHFSTWGPYVAAKIYAGDGTDVYLTTGSQKALEIRQDGPIPSDTACSPWLIFGQASNCTGVWVADHWFVNDSRGDDASGHVEYEQANPQTATYIAPNKTPDQPVKITVKCFVTNQMTRNIVTFVTDPITIHVIGKKWILNNVYAQSYDCSKTGFLFHYHVSSAARCYFHLNDDLSVTADNFDSPAIEVLDQGSCNESMEFGLTNGDPLKITAISGGFNKEANAFLIHTDFTEMDRPGYIITSSGIELMNVPVRKGQSGTLPEFFPLQHNAVQSDSTKVDNFTVKHAYQLLEDN
jgi:hypothetical protein